MANLILRDRDGIVTKEGLIFRVFGYSHPEESYVCDAEYASERIFKSSNPRAPRTSGREIFYKFYDDEGWEFVSKNFPQYQIYHKMLRKKIVGITQTEIAETRKPEKALKLLVNETAKDELVDATQRVLETVVRQSGVNKSDFGVFGSMLHGFHHPKLSDIDLIVYGSNVNKEVRSALKSLYSDPQSFFKNEFQTQTAMEGKRWRFKNFNVKEFIWHQQRKQIYGLFADSKSGRTIKAEFEPVKAWTEIKSEYDAKARILKKNWVRLKARISKDDEAPFIPSIYEIQPLELLGGSRSGLEASRIVSYMEEFRNQAFKDEIVVVEGNLEEVTAPKGKFHQISLTYCPRYYEQTLKVAL